jgi:hypothetical protein
MQVQDDQAVRLADVAQALSSLAVGHRIELAEVAEQEGDVVDVECPVDAAQQAGRGELGLDGTGAQPGQHLQVRPEL